MDGHSFLVRITRSFTDVSGITIRLASESQYVWVTQHDADESVNRTHCHFFVLNSKRDWDGWKNTSEFKKFIKDQSISGNGDWSSKRYNIKYDQYNDENVYECLKYMSKGTIFAKFSSGDKAEQIYLENMKLYVDRKKKLQAFLETFKKSDSEENPMKIFCGYVKVKKPTMEALHLEVVARYMREHGEEVMDDYNAMRKLLLKHSKDVCSEHHKLPKTANVVALAQAAMWELDTSRQIAKNFLDV